MTSLYVETSALLKRYVLEPESGECQLILDEYPHWITSRLTVTETLINLRKRLSTAEFGIASKLFHTDLYLFNVMEFNGDLSLQAAEVAEGSNLTTLDSIHLASALRIRSTRLAFITYDKQLAKAAKRNGLEVLGV